MAQVVIGAPHRKKCAREVNGVGQEDAAAIVRSVVSQAAVLSPRHRRTEMALHGEPDHIQYRNRRSVGSNCVRPIAELGEAGELVVFTPKERADKNAAQRMIEYAVDERATE